MTQRRCKVILHVVNVLQVCPSSGLISGSAGEQRSFLLLAGNSGSTQLTYAEQKEAKGVLKQ